MKTGKNAHSQRKPTKNKLFGLTRRDLQRRKIWQTILILFGVLIIVVLVSASAISGSLENRQKIWFITASFLKYITILIAAYFLARNLAAKYLDDLYELKDIKMATAFIKDLSFGSGENRISIVEGKIPEEEEKSPVLLIGGPGKMMVHLGNLALVEGADGSPRIISPRSQVWETEGFERIREIGQFDELMKREYAIINIRDQFVGELSLKTRTKDSIHIEIKGIKVMFSILRDSNHVNVHKNGRDPFTFNEDAVHALVYEQTVIKQPHETLTGIKFPWDTTIIPLIIGELEKLIQTHSLSEILTSTGSKEREDLATREEELKKLRGETTNDTTDSNKESGNTPPAFIPRAEITENFFSDEFRQKAAILGVSISWIDIGTWEIKQPFVLDKLKEAREMALQNAKFERELSKNEDKYTFDKIHELINKVVVSNFKQTFDIPTFSPTEWKKLAETIRGNPELADPYLVRQLYRQMINDKTSQLQALNMLRAFNTELLAAREIINKEITVPMAREEALGNINNALKCIAKHIYHMFGNK